MGKHIQEDDLKTVNGQSLIGTGNINIEGGSINPENIGFGLSYTDDKIQLGEESKDALGNTKHLVKLEDKDTVSIGEIVNENKRGTGGISVTKYYGTNVLIESNSSQEDNTSTLSMYGANFKLSGYSKNFNGEIKIGGIYFQNGLFYISNGNGAGTQNQIKPLEDFSAYTVGLKVDDKDYKGAIATVPYVKRTVDGLAGNGLNYANGKLNVNPKLESRDGLNFIDLQTSDGGFKLNSEHSFIAPIDGKKRTYINYIYSDEDKLYLGRSSQKEGEAKFDNYLEVSDSVFRIRNGKLYEGNDRVLNESNAKELGQFGKTKINITTSNGYTVIDATEAPVLNSLGDVVYLHAHLENNTGVTDGLPIDNFNVIGFRPVRTNYFTVPTDTGTANIKITKQGVLTIESVSNSTAKKIYINVSFLNKEIK